MADYQISADIIGAKELSEAISKVNEVAIKALSDGLNKTAIKLEGIARSGAPHLHGGLWNSLHTQLARVTGTNIQSSVGTNLVYARAQEYGTQGMTIHSHSKLGTQFTYIGNIKPKLYMQKARDAVKPSFQQYMSEAARVIISKLATHG